MPPVTRQQISAAWFGLPCSFSGLCSEEKSRMVANRQHVTSLQGWEYEEDVQANKLSCQIYLDFVKGLVEPFSPLVKTALRVILIKSWQFSFTSVINLCPGLFVFVLDFKWLSSSTELLSGCLLQQNYMNTIFFKDLVKFFLDSWLNRDLPKKTPELPEPMPHSRFGWPLRSPETNHLKSVQNQMF